MATVVHLTTLIDLAVGVQEPKPVNYTLLNSILHVIVQQLDINRVKVEFRGDDSQKIQGLLSESKIETSSHMEYKVLSQQEHHEDSKEEDHLEQPSLKSVDTGKSKESEIIYVVESGQVKDLEKRKPYQVTHSTFNRLEAKVKALQAQVEVLGIQSVPQDEKLLEVARTDPASTPISDLLHSMNITKRMSGAEEGIDKLASLLETVAKEYADLKMLLDKVQDELGLDVVDTMKEIKLAAEYARKMRPRAELYEAILKREASQKALNEPELSQKSSATRIKEVQEKLSGGSSGEGEGSAGSQEKLEIIVDEEEAERQAEAARQQSLLYSQAIQLTPDTGPLSDKVNDLIGQQEFLRRHVEYITAQINTLADFADSILPEILAGLPHMEELKQKIQEMRTKTGSEVSLTKSELDERRSKLTLEQRVEDVEGRVSSHAAKLRRQDAVFCNKYDQVLNHLKTLDDITNSIKIKFKLDESDSNSNLMSPDNIKALMSKTDTLKKDVDDIYNETQDIVLAQKKNEQIIQQVYSELEEIQSNKVDRYEMNDLLAEKADCTEVQLKVSQDVFEDFSNNLTKAMDYCIKKTKDQEAKWKKDVSKFCKLLQTKYDITEAEQLKNEILEQLSLLKERIEVVAKMKAYTMSAGTKKRLYTEVNCIACDRKAAMETTNAEKPFAPKVPPYLNVKPYITYELDQLRTMQLKNPGNKNVLLHEQILKNFAKTAGYENFSTGDVRFVNRYCGGSDTVLSPYQRVVRNKK